MKLPCELIHDLLILYDDDACSEFTRKVVEEHLRECDHCRKRTAATLFPAQEEMSEISEATVVKRSFKKIRNRWISAVLVILMLFPLGAVGILGYHEATGQGRSFTNWDEIAGGKAFLELLAEGDYEELVSRTSFYPEYEKVLYYSEMTPEEFETELIGKPYRALYKEVTINGEPWFYLDAYFDTHVPNPEIDGGGINWKKLIYENPWDIPFPEDIFREVTGITALSKNPDGTAFCSIETSPDPLLYYRLETRWGTFMISENGWDNMNHMIRKGYWEDPMASFFEFGVLLPENLFLDTENALMNDSGDSYESHIRTFQSMLARGKESFYSDMEKSYAEAIKEVDTYQFSIKKIKYDSVRRVEDRWIVSYYLELEHVGFDCTMKIDLESYDGKFRCVDYNCRDPYGRVDEFGEILMSKIMSTDLVPDANYGTNIPSAD